MIWKTNIIKKCATIYVGCLSDPFIFICWKQLEFIRAWQFQISGGRFVIKKKKILSKLNIQFSFLFIRAKKYYKKIITSSAQLECKHILNRYMYYRGDGNFVWANKILR